MHTEVRIALLLITAAVAALAAWFAWTAVRDNLAMLHSWTRTQGLVSAMPAANYVEIEIGAEPDLRRVVVSPDHQLGLSLFKTVPVYLDPADPRHARAGGLFQLWLWPAGMSVLAVIFLGLTVTAARVGRGSGATGFGAGHWMLSPPPPPLETDLRVHRPPTEWKAPLVWSLLGLALAAVGIFGPAVSPIQRLGPTSAGSLFVALMLAMSLHNATTELSADAHGLRETSAFGWRDVPWGEVGGVETQETVPTYRKPFSVLYELPFPGRTTRSFAFVSRNGGTLMRLSVAMQPRDTMRRLLALCNAQTHLTEQFRRIIVPDF